jgi:hypothetical protein
LPALERVCNYVPPSITACAPASSGSFELPRFAISTHCGRP